MEALVNDQCIYCGLCADLCPEVFQMGEERAYVAAAQISVEHRDCCREAAEECPTEAIEIIE